MRKSFTLIELIVVIGIIALLSGLGISSYNGFQQTARDTRRKEDLETITKALNAYYAVHGRFPAPDPDNIFGNEVNDPYPSGCDYNTNCYTYSTYGTNWIPALVEGDYIEALPQDPINNNIGPWLTDSTRYTYAYGNVFEDGQTYDLTTRLENTNDPDRCGVKNYRFFHDKRAWCNGESSAPGYPFGGAFPTYNNQIYEKSPGTSL